MTELPLHSELGLTFYAHGNATFCKAYIVYCMLVYSMLLVAC